MRKNRGITLIALVITIIVMLILIVVTVSLALKGGLIDKSAQVRKDTLIAQLEETLQTEIISDYDYQEWRADVKSLYNRLSQIDGITNESMYLIGYLKNPDEASGIKYGNEIRQEDIDNGNLSKYIENGNITVYKINNIDDLDYNYYDVHYICIGYYDIYSTISTISNKLIRNRNDILNIYIEENDIDMAEPME